MTTTIRKDGLPARCSLLGLPPGSPPSKPNLNRVWRDDHPTIRINKKLLMNVVRVRGVIVTLRHGGKVRMWEAYCSAPRCKFSEQYNTKNGAHKAAARHRREKALTKMHGARERVAS